MERSFEEPVRGHAEEARKPRCLSSSAIQGRVLQKD